MANDTRKMLGLSRCGNCHKVTETRKCPGCGYVASAEGYYRRADELTEECKRHQKTRAALFA